MSLITAFISSGGLILGSVIGGLISWFITKNTTQKSINQQSLIQRENIRVQEKDKEKERYINANVVRLDISTAIYQCIRSLQTTDKMVYMYAMPIYKEYHKVVASLGDRFSLNQLSHIYQIYGLMEKINRDISCLDEKNSNTIYIIRSRLWDLIKMVYGDNYITVLKKEIDNISYEELYNDPLMKNEYRKILKSLDYICTSTYC